MSSTTPSQLFLKLWIFRSKFWICFSWGCLQPGSGGQWYPVTPTCCRHPSCPTWPFKCPSALPSFQTRFINSYWDKPLNKLLVMATTPISSTQINIQSPYYKEGLVIPNICFNASIHYFLGYRLSYQSQWLPQLPWNRHRTPSGSSHLPCAWAQDPLTCHCNVDLSRSRSELSVLRKRRDPRRPKWLEAKGVVAREVTQGWSSVHCLGSGEPFHVKCYVISAWQIWLQNISRLKVFVRITNPKYLTLCWKDFPKFFSMGFSLISLPIYPFQSHPRVFLEKKQMISSQKR